MNDRILIALLTEWHHQLCEALDTAKDMLPDPEPQRIKQWKGMRFGRVPDEAPPDQWEWMTIEHTAPPLLDLEATIERIGRQIEALRVE